MLVSFVWMLANVGAFAKQKFCVPAVTNVGVPGSFTITSTVNLAALSQPVAGSEIAAKYWPVVRAVADGINVPPVIAVYQTILVSFV
ncbi:hypothetical protein D3C85_423320 [compost metagenome]